MKRNREPAVCRCGHDQEAHRHYRYGSECALCSCPRWNPPLWRRWWHRPADGG